MESKVDLNFQKISDKYTEIKKGDVKCYGAFQAFKNNKTNKTYALKIQNLKDIIHTSNHDDLRDDVLRLIREIQSFNLSHPNIARFEEAFFTRESEFVIVMELAEQDLELYRA